MAQVKNINVAHLGMYLGDFLTEMIKSESADVRGMSAHDLRRLKEYLTASLRYLDYVVTAGAGNGENRGPLDMPVTSPHLWTVQDPDEIPEDMENHAVHEICGMLSALMLEIYGSQSAHINMGFYNSDVVRITGVIEFISSFLTSYVETSTPLDLPETVPAISS